MNKEFDYSWRAMGSRAQMTVITSSQKEADKSFLHVKECIDRYENIFSRFDASSELSQLNHRKSLSVSGYFREVLKIAKELYEETQGMWNPLVQARRIGYNATIDRIRKRDVHPIDPSIYSIDFNRVVVQGSHVTLPPDCELDFGGMLKGYVAQISMATCPVKAFGMIVNIGGDLCVSGKERDGQAFVIDVISPYNKREKYPIVMEEGALCTSGSYKRRWRSDGREMHHILDPETRMSSSSDVMSATVVHTDGARADAYATTAIVGGSKKFESLLKKLDVHSALTIDENGRIRKY